MHGVWPWALMALLGAYHGLNPAMGWLFAVALGMQEGDRRAVLRALPPIALGHEASIAIVAALVLGLGVLTDTTVLHVTAGVGLILFGIFRFLRPRAHVRWVRARVNRRELSAWSFLMSTAHGAGFMVAPVLIGAGAASANASERLDGGKVMAAQHDHALADVMGQGFSVPQAGVALLVHVGAMVLVMGIVAVLIYDHFGLSVLRRSWINLDGVWAAAFVVAGVATLFT